MEICEAAFQADKPIYIDAEESWVQGAMDDLAEKMMAKYNKQKAIVIWWCRSSFFLSRGFPETPLAI